MMEYYAIDVTRSAVSKAGMEELLVSAGYWLRFLLLLYR